MLKAGSGREKYSERTRGKWLGWGEGVGLRELQAPSYVVSHFFFYFVCRDKHSSHMFLYYA
jgi:hypothetical protein